MEQMNVAENNADDAELAAAIVAKDTAHAAYVYRRLAIRRRMAVAAFFVFLIGGIALIVAGLSSNAIAQRIVHLGMIIATFMTTLAAMVGWYWGVGAYEHAGQMFGNSYGSNYGGIGGGGGLASRRWTAQSIAFPQPSSRAD